VHYLELVQTAAHLNVAKGCLTPADPTGPSQGDSLVIAEPEGERCRLVIVPSTVLQSDRSGSHPDPGPGRVLRHPSGIITNTTWEMGRGRASLLLWSSSGEFSRVIGSAGDGPGEFSTSALPDPYLGPDGKLYVTDRRRWSVLDSTLSFVDAYVSPSVDASPPGVIITSDGGVLYSGGASVRASHDWFHYNHLPTGNHWSFGAMAAATFGRPGTPPPAWSWAWPMTLSGARASGGRSGSRRAPRPPPRRVRADARESAPGPARRRR
jgi:hypothetical protein